MRKTTRRAALRVIAGAGGLLGLNGYRRRLAMTATGMVVTETSSNPRLTEIIRDHAREVTGFVRDGMPAMQGMMR